MGTNLKILLKKTEIKTREVEIKSSVHWIKENQI